MRVNPNLLLTLIGSTLALALTPTIATVVALYLLIHT